MKFLLHITITILVAYILQLFTPWWGIAIAAFLAAVIVGGKGFPNFFAGFLGIFLFWAAYSFYIDYATSSVLTSRIAQLFQLPNATLMPVVTGVIGGLVGGLAALSGGHFRTFFIEPPKKRR